MEIQQLLNKKILKYNDELSTDIKLSEMNIRDKTLSAPGLKVKWLRIFFEEKKLLNKLIESKNLKINEYVINHGLQNVPKLKTIEEAKRSEEIVKLEKFISEQKEVVDYLEQANKIMINYNFDIKNAIDILKMENS